MIPRHREWKWDEGTLCQFHDTYIYTWVHGRLQKGGILGTAWLGVGMDS